MQYIEHIISILRQLGAPGLLGLAFIDSAGIPTGGGPDWVIVVLLSARQMLADFLLIVPLAVLGSTIGCLVPYYLGRRGGEMVLRRFDASRRDAVRAKIARYGFWAMVFSVLAPPPYPMKVFIVSAGVFRMPLGTFVCAVLLGRCVRYSIVGYLAVRYGEQAGDLMREHVFIIAGVAAALIVCVLLVQNGRRRAMR